MTTKPTILASIDGSAYSSATCLYASFIAQKLDAKIKLLHVQPKHSDKNFSNDDFSGSIGLGSKKALLKKLAEIDEQQGRLDQEKGRLVLEHGANILQEQGHNPQILHLRGSLVETICELQDKVDLAIIGKRGTNDGLAKLHLGSNLERVVRQSKKPIFIAQKDFRKIKKFVIAYDGSTYSTKIVNYVKNSTLLHDFECHLINVGGDEPKLLKAAEHIENSGKFKVKAFYCSGKADDEIAKYIEEHNIDLLVMGAYGHSKIRNLIIGSITSSMLYSCPTPVLIVK